MDKLAAIAFLLLLVCAHAYVEHVERQANIEKHSKPIEWYANK